MIKRLIKKEKDCNLALARIEKLPEFKSNSDSPWLKRYSRFVTSADQGAVLI